MCNRQGFQSHWGAHKGKFMQGRHYGGHLVKHPGARGFFPPVNVLEEDDRYELLVFAPGLTKGGFNIHLKDDLLTVTGRKPESDLAQSPNWRRQEYHLESGFERSFVLNEKVDATNISATYEDGVLKITLPKLPGTETRRQDVYVA